MQRESATPYAVLSERQDLHVFLEEYRERHPEDVLVVDGEVSADQDITAIVAELAAQGRAPMVVCPRVERLSARVVTNVFASRQRVARLLGTNVAGLHETFYSASTRPQPLREVQEGPVLEVVDEGDAVDLNTLPLLKHFEHDRAPYITSAIIVAEDPNTGVGNCSYHRSMLASSTELATSLHSRGHLWRYVARAKELGRPLPVAMVIGGHPLFMLACAARVGVDVDEREIAGGLFGEPLEVVRTPRYGIAVPATSDFVLEGVIDPNAHADEGPFGEFSGYTSGRSTNNVLKVEVVLRRRDSVLLDVMGGAFADHLNLARIPRESEMATKLRERFPDVTALHYPSSGTHFHAYVALRQSMPGQARQVMLGLLGWDPYLKTVIALDDDIDLHRDEEVLWAMATRCQPSEDVFIVPGLPGSLLDPSSSASGTTSRMAIDATRGVNFEAARIEVAPRSTERARAILDGDL